MNVVVRRADFIRPLGEIVPVLVRYGLSFFTVLV